MKILLIISALIFQFVPFITFGQYPIDEKTGEVQYSDVVSFEDLTEREAYEKARTWILTNLKTSDNMTVTDDTVNLRLIATGHLILDTVFSLHPEGDGFHYNQEYSNNILDFKIIVEFRQGRYKYSLENFTLTSLEVSTAGTRKTFISGIKDFDVIDSSRKKWIEYEKIFNRIVKSYIDKRINSIINSLNSSISDEQEDW